MEYRTSENRCELWYTPSRRLVGMDRSSGLAVSEFPIDENGHPKSICPRSCISFYIIIKLKYSLISIAVYDEIELHRCIIWY